MFRSFGFDAVHGCFQNFGIFVYFRLAFGTEFVVEFVPVLGALGLVRLRRPVGDVAADELEPDFGVGAKELGGIKFEVTLLWGRGQFRVLEGFGLRGVSGRRGMGDIRVGRGFRV